MRMKWADISATQKIVLIISFSASALVILFAILQLFNVWDKAINVCVPLLGVVNSCQAYLQWKISRTAAYFSIGAAIFIFICSVVVFFL